MTQLVAVTRQEHSDKSWTRFTTYEFASRDCMAPLVGAEIARAVVTLPMAFVKQQDRFLLVAVLSLTPGTNLFVGPSGKWLGAYVPSVFRGYPFMLARGKEKNNMVLCVDQDSGLVNADKTAGEPFFDEKAEISKPVKEIMNFLTQVEKSKKNTAKAVAALAAAGLFADWPLKIKVNEGEQPVTGLYRVDETKLNKLDDSGFLALRKAQALPIAYAQLMSMGNTMMLEKMARMQKQMKTNGSDIQDIFGDDDMIAFQ